MGDTKREGEPKTRRSAASSATWPSVRAGRESFDTPTSRANVSDIVRAPVRNPVFVRSSIALSVPFTARGALAGFACALAVLFPAAILEIPIQRMESAGPRGVLAMGPALLHWIALAGSVSVAAYLARQRIDGARPGPRRIAFWWIGTFGITAGIPLAAGVARTALDGLSAALAGPGASIPGVRAVILALGGASWILLGLAAAGVAYTTAISALEGCSPGEALQILSGLRRRAGSALAAHAVVGLAFAGGIWAGLSWIAGRAWSAAGPAAPPGTLSHALLDQALRTAVTAAPAAGLLGALAAASYLVLRQIDVTTPLPLEESHGVDPGR